MTLKSRWALLLVVPLVAAISMLTFTGCESDDHDGADGTATVQGNVKDYAYGQTVQAGVVPGVLVTLEPGGYEAESDGNGNFVIANVPAGTYTVWFYFNGQKASYTLNVEDGKTYSLNNVVVDKDGNVHLDLGVSPGGGGGGGRTYGMADLAGTWDFTITGLIGGGHVSPQNGVTIGTDGSVFYGGQVPTVVGTGAYVGSASVNADGAVTLDLDHYYDSMDRTSARITGQLGDNSLNGSYNVLLVTPVGRAPITWTSGSGTYPLVGVRSGVITTTL